MRHARIEFSRPALSRDYFRYPETARVRDLLDEAARRSGVSRGQAFDDLLHVSICALSGGQMEDQYLAAIAKHTQGRKGERGCDRLAEAFGAIVDIMEQTRTDVLGDLFEGCISHGEAGQYLTPEPICELMARQTIGEADADATARWTVADPCCGSGRLLLAAAKLQPHWEFVGQDVDLQCVRMTAINLALRNLYGWVIWGNSLANERRLAYRTGFDFRGFICETPPEACPLPAKLPLSEAQAPDVNQRPPTSQLLLFD